ncbi:hybrid sensor histidine kinase/response regulator transcription factor [Flavobacterium sp.]|uniref:hybrid sensor histidine kinase/response regulator transcription factor n=1 Tax=Flavobacterium sp. TaxID=239 RepID=UPI003C6BC036
MKKNNCFFFLLLNICLLQLLGAQEANNLKFKHFSSKEGLSQSSVITIFQDKKGYIWFGTRDGLNKFDGNKFTIYRSNYRDTTSLTHSWVTAIYEDTKGDLWVGTKDGLNKYNPITNNFKQHHHLSKKNSLSNNEIWGITALNSGTLAISTSKGVNKLDIKTNQFTHLLHQPKESNSISDNRTRGFLKSKNGKLWITTLAAIDVYNPKTQKWAHYKYPENTLKEAHVNNAPVLFEAKNGIIWLGYEGGLAQFNSKTNTFEPYNLKGKKAIQSSVRTIYQDKKQQLWVGTYSGLFILNIQNQELKKYIHNENDSKSLSQNSIYKIIEDSKGDIWIGTWAGGINYFDRSFDRFKQLTAGSKNTMLNYKVVSSIVEDNNQKLWIGTEGGGINVYDRKTGLFEYLTKNNDNPNSISSNNIKSMIKDHEGNFWIGTHDGGLNFLNPKYTPFRFEHFEQSKSNGINIHGCRILSLLEDKQKNIWIGTLTNGLLFYNRAENSFTKLQKSTKSVSCIVQSTNPNVILIGGTQGLEKVQIDTKEISPISLKSEANDYHLIKSVNCIYEDKNQNYWVGTEGQGLFLYQSKNNKTINYGKAEGLPNEIIYGILYNQNNLWISTNDGLSKLDLKTHQFENFDESDGLQGNEFNYGSFLKTSNDELLFGGQNGLNYFFPKNIKSNTHFPALDIYAIEVNNKPFLKITDSNQVIELKYNQNDFNIDFVALSFSQPNKNNYAIKLEGFDQDWNDIGNKKSATYTNIDEGTYVFKVKASNSNGIWNEKETTITIKVLPAPWYTWWAYLIYIILISIALYFVRKLILIRIQERNELKNEKLEKDKLEEVNKLKLQFFTNISHEFRTPLTLILGPVQQLAKVKNNNEFVKRNLDTIQRNTKVLLQLINELLDFRKSEDGKFKLNASKDNLIPFIQNIKLSFEELARQKNIHYIFSTTEEAIEVWFDKIKMNKIIFNLLSNAFKFSSDNNNLYLNISIVKNQEESVIKDYVKIDIINFVKVIPEEHIKFIFERFYQLDQKDAEAGTGIGLSLTKNLVELHKGKIEVNSSAESGTCFSVYLPLGNAHLDAEECVDEYDETLTNLTFQKPILPPAELMLEAEEIENEAAGFNKGVPTVLIVEDNQDVRHFVKSIFEHQYNIVEAENGKLGIEMASKSPVDLIISDVMMPEMDGFELCRRIKTDILTSHIPVILLTAKTSDTHREEGYKMGANAYITKPFDAEILKIRVDNLLATRKQLISKFKKDIILEPKELTITSADEIFLEKAIKIVEENIADADFNVNVFTDQMHMSRSVLFRKMKVLTGQSINEFVRTIKLKRAGQLLISTQMNISDVAYEVGFNDLKYFRKCFKTVFDETPSTYRSKNTINFKSSSSIEEEF